jgi:dihydrodipicolinate synthase/N-acetylneuraminate lyase
MDLMGSNPSRLIHIQAQAKQGARDVAEALMGWYVELHDTAVVDAGVRGVRASAGRQSVASDSTLLPTVTPSASQIPPSSRN